MADGIINSTFNEPIDFLENIQGAVKVPGTTLDNDIAENILELSTVLNSIVGVTLQNASTYVAIFNDLSITENEFGSTAIRISGMYPRVGDSGTVTMLLYVSTDSTVYDLVAHNYIGNGKYLGIGNTYGQPYSKNVYWFAMQLDF